VTLDKLGSMYRPKRQRLISYLLLAAMLLAPLQVFASVYASMDVADMSVHKAAHPCQDGEKDGHDCLHHKQVMTQNGNGHCQSVDCSSHCNSCAHCQFFISAPFSLSHLGQTRIERGTDIAFISHIPQVDFRPPKHS
jgi:hypothetical protein